MSLPLGTTVWSQLLALKTSTDPNQKKKFTGSGLSRELLARMEEDEGSDWVQKSLKSPGIQSKLKAIGIDVDATWVVVAKTAADPQRDWLPSLRTREQIAQALAPYHGRLGVPFGRVFMGGMDIRFFLRQSDRRLPSLDVLTRMVAFLTQEARTGNPKLQWNSDDLLFFEVKGEVFGVQDLLPSVTNVDSFREWFARTVSVQKNEEVARRLGFQDGTLMRWRAPRDLASASTPSAESLRIFLRGVMEHYPQWLEIQPAVTIQAQEPAQEMPVAPPAPSEPTPATEQTSAPVSPALALLELIAAQRERTRAVQALLEADEQVLRRLEQVAASMEQLTAPAPVATIPSMPEAASAAASASPVPACEPSASDELVSGRDEIGERMNGIRFVLTVENFREVEESFTLEEVADTVRLLEEVARRMALINSMSDNDKRIVQRGLEKAWQSLLLQFSALTTPDRSLALQDMRQLLEGLTAQGNLARTRR